MKEALNKAQTLVQFIEVFANYYDLQNHKPTKMILQILTTAISTAVNIQDRSVIEAALKSITLYDFLMTFAKYYDKVNNVLSLEHKHKLIEKIQTLITITRAKAR